MDQEEMAREYLKKAYLLDVRIESKLDEIAQLNSLAQRVTSVFSDIPPSGTRNVYRFSDTIAKIVDYERIVDKEIDKLVDLKREIHGVIDAVDNPEYRTLLDMRYLQFKPWEEIALQLQYTTRYIHKMHKLALVACDIPEENEIGH